MVRVQKCSYMLQNCFTVKRADSVEGSTNSINKSMAKINHDSMIYFCVMIRKGFYSKNMKTSLCLRSCST